MTDIVERLQEQLAECERERDALVLAVADHVGELYEQLATVTKERDELVEAMKLIQFSDYKHVAKVARDALAKVGEGEK